MTSIEDAGNKIAKKFKYRTLRGRSAIIRYLCDKHHWTPEAVRKLGDQDIKILLDGDFGVEAFPEVVPTAVKRKRLTTEEISQRREVRRSPPVFKEIDD